MGKVRWVAVAVLAVGLLRLGWVTGQPPRVHACDVVPPEAFKSELGWTVGTGRSATAEPPGVDDTVCFFGNTTRSAQIFEVHDGSKRFYETQLGGGSPKQVIDGSGYRAFLWRDWLFLYSQGEYVNVRLAGFPAGSVTKLIPSIVERLKQ